MNSKLPVGAFYFVFVCLSEMMMRKTKLDAKKGADQADRLVDVVSEGKVD